MLFLHREARYKKSQQRFFLFTREDSPAPKLTE
jgi:hypothetical protein